MSASEPVAERPRRPDNPTKGDRREQAILDAAEALLEERGLDPVTVEQIAAGAGISRASLYFYFGSKQEVVTALVARTMGVTRDDADTLAAEVDVPPQTTIERSIRRIEKQWLDHGVVMRAAVDNAPSNPEVREIWRGTVDLYVDLLGDVLVRAGVPDDGGPTGARALAKGLAWMGERNFYIASAISKAEVRRVAETVLAIWFSTIEDRVG
ncbi:MAG: TetR/AcrR family transcriptional regulator [Actinobacteria bacterium]|nr:TetR/AcrR family transcriptional regulator [Actinomycetota bacterium]